MGAAAAAVSAVNDVDDYFYEEYDDYDDYFYEEYEHADRYRGAAGWLVLVGIAAIIYHIVMIIIRILYFAAKSGHTFGGYSFTVSDLTLAVYPFVTFRGKTGLVHTW